MGYKKLFGVLFLASVIAGCNDKKPSQKLSAVPVSVITVGGSNAAMGSEYVGTVEEKTGAVLSFEIPGNVTSLNVAEGDRVARGRLLAKLSPTSLRDAHYATKVQLSQARDAYRRMKPLHENGVISDIKWVDVESKLRQAEAAERIAREQLGHTGLYAPFAGVISGKYAERGMNVMAGQQIYKLVDISEVNVRVSVPENDISHIAKGRSAKVAVKALGNAVFGGVVSEKGVSANPVSHTYDVLVTVSNTGGRLMPGMVCSVAMQPSGTGGGLVSVPLSSVELDTDNSRFVWVVENGKAAMRKITVGGFSPDGVYVTSGLAQGDKLIVAGAQKVSNGMKVEVR